jgi:hypothetical protein
MEDFKMSFAEAIEFAKALRVGVINDEDYGEDIVRVKQDAIKAFLKFQGMLFDTYGKDAIITELE